MGDGPNSADGLATAVEVARRLADPPEDPGAEQGDLFGALPVDPDGAGDAAPPEPGRRGRPPGARNRSTDDWTRFLLTRYRSPLLGLAEIAQATPRQLQVALGGKPSDSNPDGASLAECLRIILTASQALAPYLHQKQPTAIEGAGLAMMTLIIEKGGASDPAAARILPIEENEENQDVSETGAGMSE